MADTDVTVGNSFLNSEGANTAVLPDTNEFPSTLLAANKQIWDEKRQVAAAHQKQIAESAKNLDFTNADMSTSDQAAVQGKIGGFRDKYSNNLNALTGQDTVANGKMLNDRGVVNYFIDKGKADKLVYDNNVKAIQDHPALYDQQSIDDLNKWYNQPLDSRGNPPVLTTKPTFNPVLDEHDFQAAVKPEAITTGSVNTDGTHTTVTTQKVDPVKFTATANTMYNNAVENQGLLETVRRQQVNAKSGSGNNPDIPTWDSNNLFGKDGKLAPTGTTKLADANPFDVYMYNKQALAKNYVSKDVTAGKDNTGVNAASEDNWAIDYTSGLLNHNVAGKTIQSDDNGKGKDYAFYPTPSTWTETKLDENNQEKKSNIVGVVEAPDGKYYKAHDNEVSVDPKNTNSYQYKTEDVVKPQNEITNPWLQVIIPNTSTQKERDKAALQIWTQHPDEAQKFGVPKPLGLKDNTPTATTNQVSLPKNPTEGQTFQTKDGTAIFKGGKWVLK